MIMIRVGHKKDKVGVYKEGVSSTKFKFATPITIKNLNNRHTATTSSMYSR